MQITLAECLLLLFAIGRMCFGEYMHTIWYTETVCICHKYFSLFKKKLHSMTELDLFSVRHAQLTLLLTPCDYLLLVAPQ